MLHFIFEHPFVYHLSLMIALGASTVLLPRERFRPHTHALLHGLIFGGVAVIGMLNPILGLPGIFFDGRTVVISLCGLFFGPVSVALAGGMAIAFRIYQGGAGMPVGVLIVLSAALIGVLARRWRSPSRGGWNIPRFVALGLLVHGVMLLELALLLYRINPAEFLEILQVITIPVLVLYPCATALLGKILHNQAIQSELLHGALQSEARLRSVMVHAPVAMALSDNEGRISFRNDHFIELFGYTEEDVKTVAEWMERAYPDPEVRRRAEISWTESVAQARADHAPIPAVEYRVTSHTGRQLYVEITGIAMDSEILVVFKDVTGRRVSELESLRLRRLYAMLSQTNKLITRARNREELLQGVCEIAVNAGRFRFVWLGVPEADGSVTPVARAGEDGGYIDAIQTHIDPNHPRGNGPTARVLRSGETVITNRFVSSMATTPWHDMARNLHIAASGVFPIRHQGRVYGALNLYASDEDFFGVGEITTVEEMAADISYALDNLALEEARARAVAEARNLSEQLTHYLAVSPVISYMLRLEGSEIHAVWVSENIEPLLGYTAAEALTPGWWITNLHPDDRATALAAMGSLAPDGEMSHEYRFMRKDGTELWVLDSLKLSSDANDGCPVYFGAWADVTDRKTNEEYLRLQGAALNAAANAIAVTNVEGRIVWVNSAFTAVTQYEASEAVGRTPGELLRSGKHGPEFYANLWDTILEGRVWRGLITNRRKDGTLYTEEQAITPIRDWNGNITHFVGIKEDVTERVRTEAALRDSQERLQRALAIGKGALWQWELAGDRVYYSPEWRDHTGAPEFGASGTLQEWLARVHPEDLVLLQRDFARERPAPKPTWERQFRLRDESGDYRWILMNASWEYDGAGRPFRLIGMNVDISERKRLEHEFEQAQKLESIGRLAGGVAHDFNNLLNVITGYTEMALAVVEPAENLHKDLQQILRAADRAANLTRQLLAFSRRQVLSPEVLNVNRIISDAEKMLRRLIGEDVELGLELAPDLGQTMADPGQIEQVVMNLVVNARDAMPGGGRIFIRTDNVILRELDQGKHIEFEPGNYVRIAVIDDGSGMSEAVLERIFEPFFTTKEQGKGTGLGLATVYGIVKQSGGTVNVISSPGLGTTIEIYLPRIDSAETRAPSDFNEPTIGGHETILLVEDEPDLLILARRCVESAGYRAICAANGDEARVHFLAEEGRVDLLLTDVIMPGMSGPALAASLQAARPDLPVLYMSGYTDDALAHHGVLDAGINLLLKPFSPAQLTAKIREVLDAKGGGNSSG